MDIKCELKEKCKLEGTFKAVYLGFEGAAAIFTPIALSSSAGVSLVYSTSAYILTMSLDYMILYNDNFLALDAMSRGISAIFASMLLDVAALGKDDGLRLSGVSFLSVLSLAQFPELKLSLIGKEEFAKECCCDLSGKTVQFDLDA